MFAFVEQEAAQQELSQQREQYEERVTHLHEAMVSHVLSAKIAVLIVQPRYSGL